ncbi:hypothetical protein Glove_52g41 [Diversispora epigaea]|uniref:Uncharacterized protein n=1 Tax=Diversispora epigaea TaxID=1348612 RepID=A0A397JMX3_9GLOM|nr:hypothetical protein Glove_52g41 [Diversispora epigaea]
MMSINFMKYLTLLLIIVLFLLTSTTESQTTMTETMKSKQENIEFESTSTSIMTVIVIPTQTTTTASLSCTFCKEDTPTIQGSVVTITKLGDILTTITPSSLKWSNIVVSYITTTFVGTTTIIYRGYTTTLNRGISLTEVLVPPSTVVAVKKVTASILFVSIPAKHDASFSLKPFLFSLEQE